ncbi:hypothetical protein K431DRAFT_220482 [Polychaeton citri CBS 116435]|uniref:MARVEL domain-containing protein n=1 Tax=Polychaeton citri CBS 116435 TaxID=1314669 RepID=A0A9P4Q9P2_9PEZI|nr:hypothetical protein K431DRAFT_220482 [Polychaeton citri CBS 116435]
MQPINTALAVRILRIIQAIFAVIVLGTTAYVANWWTSQRGWHASTPSEIAFLIFVSVWTLLALVYLVVVPWQFSQTQAAHIFAITVVEGVTMLFWFAGFIALAVWLSDRDCYGNVCSSARAGTIFGAFEWYAGLACAPVMAKSNL